MEISDEIVAVLFVKAHEGASHDDEFNLVCVVTEALELFDSVFGLEVWVVAGADGTHGGWFVACIALR